MKTPAPVIQQGSDAFPLPPRVEWVGPRRGIFRAPFAFISPSLGRIEIEEGFDTDYASVPRGLWNLYPPDGEYSPAAWIHDWLYWNQALNGRPVKREEADAVFLEAMTALGIGWVTRRILHRAVRLGGGVPWERVRRERWSEPTLAPAKSLKTRFFKSK